MLINSFIKKTVKKLLALFPIAISKNEFYDRYTKKIIASHCNNNSVCIDIGSNEGKILNLMISAAPNSKHYAFEPIPSLCSDLIKKYANQALIYPIALSDQKGFSEFNFVTTNSALSGLKKRPYPSSYLAETIVVATDLLDNIITEEKKISLIKIDVEGGEWNVLNGAKNTIHRSNPLILFECGKIGGDLYGFDASAMFDLFYDSFNYRIYTLKGWLNGTSELSFSEFEKYFKTGSEYFFLAAPKNIHKNS